MDVAVSLQNEYVLEPVIESVKAQFAALGLTPQMFVSKRICIKPNLLLKRTPEEATTTHPVVVRAVVETLLSYGVKAQNMVIADSPGVCTPKAI